MPQSLPSPEPIFTSAAPRAAGVSRAMHLPATPLLGRDTRVSLALNSPPELAGPSPGRGRQPGLVTVQY